MHITVVTGMSGAGKTQALRMFEDYGYFCIDNMPPALLPRLMEMYASLDAEAKVALVIDARVGQMITELLEQIRNIRNQGHRCEILFLDADDDDLINRYKETRRAHPVETEGGLLDSIQAERVLLKNVRCAADIVVDTSDMKLKALYNHLKGIFISGGSNDTIRVRVVAFGYKYGAPSDADLMFDVRCLPNPFYIENLKHMTGNDKQVQDWVMQFPESQQFFDKIKDMADFLLPLYAKDGRGSLNISVGCTGGKHRSVTFAKKLTEYITSQGYSAHCSLRDVDKE